MSVNRCAIIVLSKPPLKGKVKTRLTPHYSFEDARQFHQVCVEQVWFNLHQCQITPPPSFQIERFISASHPDPFWLTLLQHTESDLLFLQSEGDIGHRMNHAFQWGFEHISSFNQVILLGTDSPSLPLTFIDQALHNLQSISSEQCVFGPACDGGYYLIGINRTFYEQYQD